MGCLFSGGGRAFAVDDGAFATGAADQSLIQVFHGVGMALPGVVVADKAVQAGGREGVGPVAFEEAENGLCEIGGSGSSGNQARVQQAEYFRRGSHRRADDGRAAGEGFGGDEAKAFEGECGQYKHIRRLIIPGQLVIGDKAEQADMVLQAVLCNQPFQMFALWPFAANQQEGIGTLCDNRRHGLDEIIQPHPGGEAAHRQQEGSVHGQPERPAHVGTACGGREAFHISPARDQVNVFVGIAEGEDFAAGMLAEHHDAVTALEVRAFDGMAQECV